MATPLPCNDCVAGCCRGYNVVVTGFDAFRLARALAAPPSDFCDLRWAAAPEGHYRILLNALPGAEKRYYRLVLRRLDGDHPRFEHRCTFLLTVGERGRCGVYEARPNVCRTYPTSLDGESVGFDSGGRWCPPGAWTPDLVDVPLARLQHRRRDRHLALWNALVDGWNARLLATSEAVGHAFFYRFLLDAYVDLAARAPALDDPDGDVGALAADTLRAIGY